jgi:spermidine synthase
MRRLSLGVLLVALSTLVLELMLTRVFDVTLTPNLAYFVISLAILSFGVAGLLATLWPLDPRRDIRGVLVACCTGFTVAVLLLHPLINALPLNPMHIIQAPLTTLGAFGALYLGLLVPFGLAGYVLITVFSTWAERIQRLYFWDLVGAGIGTVIVVPFILEIGPGGLIVCAAALGLVAAALFSGSRAMSVGCTVVAIAIAAVPAVRGRNYIDFEYHMDKRDILTAVQQGRDRLVRWDPISKIDIIDQTLGPQTINPWHTAGNRMAIQYDGGNQTSYFYQFDGNLAALRASISRDPARSDGNFWQIGVLAAHYLKRDTHPRVLVIGSAGGEETKAALMYGARRVDAVELVPTVMRLALGRYSAYIGNILHHPAVHPHTGDGRSYLQHSHRKYDIIQLYSDYTSSSIAQGTGAVAPLYLYTVEAFEQYFSHLTPDGVLQINNFAYPRMITTAAAAWQRVGRTDFQRHVAVYFCPSQLTLPTLLISSKPWTPAQIASLDAFLGSPKLAPRNRLTLVEYPLEPAKSFLPAVFYSGAFPSALAERIPADFAPVTDDWPYYGELREHLGRVTASPGDSLDPGTAYVLNSSIVHGVPMDVIHLFLTGAAAVVFTFLLIMVPLRFSRVGRDEGATAIPLLMYFSCLGAGFIILELVFIQKFMNLIGSPLYTYSTVIFTMLFSAGLGSATSERLGLTPWRRWHWPFLAVIAFGLALVVGYPRIASLVLAQPLAGRVALSGALLFPLGFFLGMPFPLGILAIRHQPRGAVAWAWGMNGIFTAVGGLLAALLSLWQGFNFTILVGLACYAGALSVFVSMRDSPAAESGSDPYPSASAGAAAGIGATAAVSADPPPTRDDETP